MEKDNECVKKLQFPYMSSTVWASHSSWYPFIISLCIKTKSYVALNNLMWLKCSCQQHATKMEGRYEFFTIFYFTPWKYAPNNLSRAITLLRRHFFFINRAKVNSPDVNRSHKITGGDLDSWPLHYSSLQLSLWQVFYGSQA